MLTITKDQYPVIHDALTHYVHREDIPTAAKEEASFLVRVIEQQTMPEELAPLETLTAREIEVLRALTHGNSNKQIGTALHISVETVKEHVHHILEKLRAKNRTEAATIAVRHGLA